MAKKINTKSLVAGPFLWLIGGIVIIFAVATVLKRIKELKNVPKNVKIPRDMDGDGLDDKTGKPINVADVDYYYPLLTSALDSIDVSDDDLITIAALGEQTRASLYAMWNNQYEKDLIDHIDDTYRSWLNVGDYLFPKQVYSIIRKAFIQFKP